MKIQITIPESAMEDVKEYCRIEEMDLHARMQDELDAVVKNILWYMEQKRQVEKSTRNLQETIASLKSSGRLRKKKNGVYSWS